MNWYRAYHDMHLDPKWRIVAVDAGCKVRDVLAVWIVMLNRASKSDVRGSIAGWNDRAEGAAIDMRAEEMRAIREAMQGLVLDGEEITNWSKYQPRREDGSAERAKAWRERTRTQANADQDERTHTNANSSPRTHENTEERREEKKDISDAGASESAPVRPAAPVVVPKPGNDPRGSRLHPGWQLPDDWREWAEQLGMPPPIVTGEADKFRDYWTGKPGANGRKSDWAGTWRNWCRRVMETRHGQRGHGQPQRGASGILAAVADLEAADRRHADFGDGF